MMNRHLSFSRRNWSREQLILKILIHKLISEIFTRRMEVVRISYFQVTLHVMQALDASIENLQRHQSINQNVSFSDYSGKWCGNSIFEKGRKS